MISLLYQINILLFSYSKVTDLHDDTKYEFRVIAENKMGQSKPSGASEQIHTKDPWSKFVL